MVRRTLLIAIVIVIAAIAAVWIFQNYYYNREQTIYIKRDSK